MDQPDFKEPDDKPVTEEPIVPVEKEGAEKPPPKIVRKQEVTVEGQNIVEQETDHIKEVKVIKKVVKKESGEPPRFSRPIQPQVSCSCNTHNSLQQKWLEVSANIHLQIFSG